MKSYDKTNDTPVLKKHVNTIHCSNNMTLVQRKLFNVLLYNAYHRLPVQSTFEIPVKTLCELIGYHSRDFKGLRKSIMDLMVTVIEWNVISQEPHDKQEKWSASSIIAAAKIENGICAYEFSSVMRELLYHPDLYGKIDMNVMVEFSSTYGLALYENCVRFQGISRMPWIPIDVFRKLMGVPVGAYTKFHDFRKRVLDIAVKEVNECSPINVTPEITRINRKITGIKFKLSESYDDTKNVSHSEIDLTVDQLMDEFGFSAETAKNLASKYSKTFIEEKIHIIKSSENYKNKKIREMGGYLIDALRRDYKIGKSSKIPQSVTPTHDIDDKTQREQEEKKRLSEIRETRMIVDNYLSMVSKEEYNYLLIQFEKRLSRMSSYALKQYKASGLGSNIVKKLFDSYVKEISLHQEMATIT